MLMALTVGAATAQDPFSANWMFPGCKEDISGGTREAYKQGLCSGIVGAMIFVLPAVRGGCAKIPPGVTIQQGVRVVVAYIEARPNRMHEDFKVLALEALRAAWPCEK
jgi:hypothetical protein